MSRSLFPSLLSPHQPSFHPAPCSTQAVLFRVTDDLRAARWTLLPAHPLQEVTAAPSSLRPLFAGTPRGSPAACCSLWTLFLSSHPHLLTPACSKAPYQPSVVFSPHSLVVSSSLKALKALPNFYLPSIQRPASPLQCASHNRHPQLSVAKTLPPQMSPSHPSSNFSPNSWTHPPLLFLSYPH